MNEFDLFLAVMWIAMLPSSPFWTISHREVPPRPACHGKSTNFLSELHFVLSPSSRRDLSPTKPPYCLDNGKIKNIAFKWLLWDLCWTVRSCALCPSLLTLAAGQISVYVARNFSCLLFKHKNEIIWPLSSHTSSTGGKYIKSLKHHVFPPQKVKIFIQFCWANSVKQDQKMYCNMNFDFSTDNFQIPNTIAKKSESWVQSRLCSLLSFKWKVYKLQRRKLVQVCSRRDLLYCHLHKPNKLAQRREERKKWGKDL